ncbi:MAG: D-glycerate dehydrogenase [Rhodovibrionaceae bacterium]|nr:D-glycerate dehydrogenase [Rhodovibrionaceae bacterium]
MSDKPKLLVTRRMPDAVTERIERDYDATLNADDKIFGADEIIQGSEGMDAILATPTEKLSASVIAELPDSVRIVANFAVGYDHVDVQAAAERDIVVTNTPDVLTDATAEINVLCMLGAARRAGEAERLVRRGAWKAWSTEFMVGKEMSGARVGILGMGRIGRAVAERCRGFAMAIHYHNRRRLSPDEEQGATYHETPESLFEVSDFLSINCPATNETRGLVNARRIELLPDGAVIANTARGPIVDDEALIAALKSGKVAAAGLDVFNNEPNLHPGYLELENAFLLPHIGSATVKTRNAMGFRALDNLDAFFAGDTPGDRVN